MDNKVDVKCYPNQKHPSCKKSCCQDLKKGCDENMQNQKGRPRPVQECCFSLVSYGFDRDIVDQSIKFGTVIL